MSTLGDDEVWLVSFPKLPLCHRLLLPAHNHTETHPCGHTFPSRALSFTAQRLLAWARCHRVMVARTHGHRWTDGRCLSRFLTRSYTPAQISPQGNSGQSIINCIKSIQHMQRTFNFQLCLLIRITRNRHPTRLTTDRTSKDYEPLKT